MILLSILDQLPVSDTTLAIIAGSISAFFGGFFAILRLRMTKPERDADAAMDNAKAFEILAAQIIKSGDRADRLFDRVVAMGERQDAEREMYRQREKEREEQSKMVMQALEKSLIEAQERIKDLNERIENQQQIQDKLKADYSLQERLVEEQGKRIKALEESEKQAHRLVIEKDLKIAELEKRVKELEAEIAALKAQQPAAIAAVIKSEPIPEIKELVDSIVALKSDDAPQPGESSTPAAESEANSGNV